MQPCMFNSPKFCFETDKTAVWSAFLVSEPLKLPSLYVCVFLTSWWLSNFLAEWLRQRETNLEVSNSLINHWKFWRVILSTRPRKPMIYLSKLVLKLDSQTLLIKILRAVFKKVPLTQSLLLSTHCYGNASRRFFKLALTIPCYLLSFALIRPGRIT